MDRRSFLRGLAAAPVGAVAVAVAANAAVPEIESPIEWLPDDHQWQFATFGDYIFVTDSEGFQRFDGHEWLTEALKAK